MSSMNNELYLLSDWLKRQRDLPKKRTHKETFLDISGIDHLENPWSDIYAYFLNPKASHGFSRLFIDSLQSIISSKTCRSPLIMKTFSVLREDRVEDEKGNKKRIDLLLKNEGEAIIIENKVYAPLYNRLDLYWSKPKVPEENKRGVVLSLRFIHLSTTDFINITHEEYARTIEKNLPRYFANADPKALILLQDFIQNIFNITHTMNEEEISFYFENREKINRLAEIRKSFITHVRETIEGSRSAMLLRPRFKEAGLNLSVKQKNNGHYCYYAFDELPDKVMLTLVYDTIWNYNDNGCRIRMFLELQSKEMISFIEQHSQHLKSDLGLESDGLKKETTWWHYKGIDIRFDNPKELSNENEIATRIVEAIKDSHFYGYGQQIINLWNHYHK